MNEKLILKEKREKSHNTLRTSQNSGITLVALIITIIVLLILAVVAIRAVSNDGIISHAKNARDEYEQAQTNEQTTLEGYLGTIEGNIPKKIPDGGVYYRNIKSCYCGTYNNMEKEAGFTCEICNYTFKERCEILTSGDYFPTPVYDGDTNQGDLYDYGDYRCSYNGTNWSIRVIDTTKTSYGEIPTEISGQYLTSLGGTYSNCKNLITPPEIPDGITNMDSTFYGCTSLKVAPTIPNTVTKMNYTFYNCTSLTTAPAIPSGVKSNLQNTFSNCTSLVTVEKIPEGVTALSSTFLGCTALKSAPELPSSLTSMQYTFKACTSLTTAPTIPNSVTYMYGTFYGCTSLKVAPTIPSGVTNMQNTFKDCISLADTIEINANPKYYGNCLKSTQITGITGSCSQETKDALIATK